MNDRKDEEENRLSARAARYVRVGSQCRGGGGARRRPAAARPRGGRCHQCGGAGGGAGRPQGADHEGGAAAGHHPGGAAGGIRAGAVPAAVAGAAHGAGVRAPAHGGGAGRGVGLALQELRAAAGGLRVAGPGASRRRPRRRPAGGQAAVSRHAVGGGGRPQPAQGGVRAARAHEPGGGHGRDPEGGVGAAARGAGLRPGSAPHGALRPDLQGRAHHPRAGGGGGALDQAAADHDLARGPAAARLQGGAAGGSQRHRPRDVQGVVVPVLALRRDPRRSASRQLHDLFEQRRRTGRAAALRGASAGRPASTCSTTAASAPSRRRSCRA